MITRGRPKKRAEKLLPLRLGPPRISACSNKGLNPRLYGEKSGSTRLTCVTLFVINSPLFCYCHGGDND
jgi:hypothetical protein